MKKAFIYLMTAVLLFSVVFSAAAEEEPSVLPLKVNGTTLEDAEGNPVLLRGISTHGLAWFPEYVNEATFAELREGFGANLVRLAMYTAENGGYCEDGDPTALKALVKKGVQLAVQQGMYVIVDWHILSDNDPSLHKEEAIAFFREMSETFQDCPNVLYEICNEPNGNVSWAEVRAYALEVIPAIRENAPDAVILVGTPNWCQSVDKAAEDPITEFENIMYSLHFYAASDKQSLRDNAEYALSKGLPLFVTEFGICSSDGNGEYDIKQANAWLDLMDEKGLCFALWNLSNKDELSAVLKADCTKLDGFTSDDLSLSGLWLSHVLGGALEVPFEGMDERPDAVVVSDNLCADPSGWGAWIDTGAGAAAKVTEADGIVTAEVEKPGASSWFVQPHYFGLALESGATYELTFTVEASCPIIYEAHVQQNYSPYASYGELVGQEAGPEPTTCQLRFSMTEPDDRNVSLCFNVGANDCAPYSVSFRDISLIKIG